MQSVPLFPYPALQLEYDTGQLYAAYAESDGAAIIASNASKPTENLRGIIIFPSLVF
jgi:hypothetical protein